MRLFLSLTAAIAMTACAQQEPITGTTLPFFGDGYRAKGDQCRRVGENNYTNQFLDDAADLVGCPEDMENLGMFALDTGGVEVARIDGFVLYSVPVR